MTTEPEEIFDVPSDLDDEDLWVRGTVYVHYKRLLEQAEANIPNLERNVARARYEYDITQRIRNRMTDPQECEDWEIRESVAHDIMVMAEGTLAEETEDAAHYRAMVAEIESDLGDKAQAYEAILADFDWEIEDWEEEDWEEEDFEDEEFDLFAPIPFSDEDDEFEDEGDEDDQAFEEASL
jgi:hypothetical protein